jgi:hypothetical protein
MLLRALFNLSRLAGETWLASGRTIAHRSRMLAAAAGDPAALGHPEFSRMGSEKLAAALEASARLAATLPALQLRWGAWWVDQGWATAAMFAARPQDLARSQAALLGSFLAIQQSFTIALARDGIEMATAALRPVHRTASGNARRLHRRKTLTSVGASRRRL